MQPDLIERLKLIIDNPWIFDRLAQCDVEAIQEAITALPTPMPDEAADMLERQQRRIAELEARVEKQQAILQIERDAAIEWDAAFHQIERIARQRRER